MSPQASLQAHGHGCRTPAGMPSLASVDWEIEIGRQAVCVRLQLESCSSITKLQLIKTSSDVAANVTSTFTAISLRYEVSMSHKGPLRIRCDTTHVKSQVVARSSPFLYSTEVCCCQVTSRLQDVEKHALGTVDGDQPSCQIYPPALYARLLAVLLYTMHQVRYLLLTMLGCTAL